MSLSIIHNSKPYRYQPQIQLFMLPTVIYCDVSSSGTVASVIDAKFDVTVSTIKNVGFFDDYLTSISII